MTLPPALGPVLLLLLLQELNNGRLAMIAWVGMVVQELATGHKLF
mgnify:CR=1 FL=1